MRHAQRHGTPALILKDMLQAWSKTCHDCLGPWPLHPETILCPLLPLLRARARRYIEEHACYARALTRTYKHTRTLWTDRYSRTWLTAGSRQTRPPSTPCSARIVPLDSGRRFLFSPPFFSGPPCCVFSGPSLVISLPSFHFPTRAVRAGGAKLGAGGRWYA